MRAAAALLCVLAFITAASAEDGSPDRTVAIRNVTPPTMTAPPPVDGPLTRIPPPVRPPEPARWWRFELPVTTDAATFVTNGRTIRVSGVVPPPVAETCPASGDATWPCGQIALNNLRLFLHGRPVQCYYPSDADPTAIVAPCRVGPTDVGAWLLTQGWATPAEQASDDYRHDADEARCAGRGIWRGSTPPAAACAKN